MTAHDNMNQTQFFHGTVAKLRPGSVVKPAASRGGKSNYVGMSDPKYAYATSGDQGESAAWHYAELSANWADKGGPRVYEVSPMGEHEPDPNDNTNEGDRRSKAGWKVTRQVPQPDWAKGWD